LNIHYRSLVVGHFQVTHWRIQDWEYIISGIRLVFDAFNLGLLLQLCLTPLGHLPVELQLVLALVAIRLQHRFVDLARQSLPVAVVEQVLEERWQFGQQLFGCLVLFEYQQAHRLF
jgi:hypothetical protein